MKQCDNYSTSEQAQCCYVEGHSGEHYFSRMDESDRIRWKLAADQRDAVMAERDILRGQVEALKLRQSELLATIVRLTNETPFSDEAKDALEQRGKLVAEVGTLRSEVARMEERETKRAEIMRRRDAEYDRRADELRAENERLKALLATPCDTVVKCHNNGRGPRVVFEVGSEDFVVTAERAQSLGAALMRAALASNEMRRNDATTKDPAR